MARNELPLLELAAVHRARGPALVRAAWKEGGRLLQKAK